MKVRKTIRMTITEGHYLQLAVISPLLWSTFCWWKKSKTKLDVIGKTIATVGMWGSIAVIVWIMHDTPYITSHAWVLTLGLFALFGTGAIWMKYK